eukprot:16312693-Heterocapsa_arctica.AAC.1
MRAFPYREDLLHLPGVLDHHSHPAEILPFKDRSHGRGETSVEALTGCRAFGSSDLLPGEPGFLEQQDVIRLMHCPCQPGAVPGGDVGRDRGPFLLLPFLVFALGRDLRFPNAHAFLLVV